MVWVLRMTPCSQRAAHVARDVGIGGVLTYGSSSDAPGLLRISRPEAAPYGDLLSVQGAPKGGGQKSRTKLQIGRFERRARALCAPNPSHRCGSARPSLFKDLRKRGRSISDSSLVAPMTRSAARYTRIGYPLLLADVAASGVALLRRPGPRVTSRRVPPSEHQMRVLILLALASVGCRTRIDEASPPQFHLGPSISALPGSGFGVTAGQVYSDRGRFNYALEASAARHETTEGTFSQASIGVKQTASPGHETHWVFHYGLTWFRSTGSNGLIDVPGDYVGGYVGAGYEWHLARRVTLGPIARLAVVNGEGSLDTLVLPQFGLVLLFHF